MQSVDRLNAATDRLFAPREVRIPKAPRQESLPSSQYEELNGKIEVLAKRLADVEDVIIGINDIA